MQIICTKRRDKKGKETKTYIAHPSFSVPWGINTQGRMIWGTVGFEVIIPRNLEEKVSGETKFWTKEQNGGSYLTDFCAENDQPKGLSLKFRDEILNYIKPVIEKYVAEYNEIKEDALREFIKSSDEYKNMRKYFNSPQNYATDVEDIIVVQVKPEQESN